MFEINLKLPKQPHRAPREAPASLPVNKDYPTKQFPTYLHQLF